ncbi:MAG: hypothetical protein Q8K92_19845 [Leadbetterella sp.]|nr:hypothetical protein [Leadbetterella sp.]
MKHLETFEAACEVVGIDSKNVPNITNLPIGHAKAIISTYMLFVISEASWKQKGEKIDWNNYDQRKFYPWFDLEKYSGSASGFSCLGFGCGGSDSGVGSRLVFPDRETAEYVGKTHLHLYKDLMVIEE